MKWLNRAIMAAALVLGLDVAREAEARREGELQELMGEVRILRTLRELELSAEQVRKLHGLARQANELRIAFEQDLEGLKAEGMERLTRYKEELVAGREPSKRERKEAKELHKQFREKRRDLEEKMQPLVEELRALLTAEQKQELERLGRGRQGGRGAEGALGQVLQRVRHADEKDYAALRERVLQRQAEMLREHGMSEEQIAEQSAKLGSGLDEARTLDEASFEARREELAQSLIPARPGREGREQRGFGRQARRGEREDRDGESRGGEERYGRWLANEMTLRALEALVGQPSR